MQNITSENLLDNPNFNRCRICLLSEDEINDEVLNVCACRGSAGSIHLDCLETWLKMTDRMSCEICSQPYRIVRQPLYGILSSIPAFVNENAAYKRSFGYFVLALIFFSVTTPYIVDNQYASWDYTLVFFTVIAFFLLNAFVTAVKEWYLWRQEQYRLTPTYHRRRKNK